MDEHIELGDVVQNTEGTHQNKWTIMLTSAYPAMAIVAVLLIGVICLVVSLLSSSYLSEQKLKI